MPLGPDPHDPSPDNLSTAQVALLLAYAIVTHPVGLALLVFVIVAGVVGWMQ